MVTLTPMRGGALVSDIDRSAVRLLRSAGGASTMLWLLLPLLTWLLAHGLIVRPAERSLMHAQQTLLAAEREELSAQLAVEREAARRQRDERELRDLKETAERMRVAELAAEAELAQQARTVRVDHVFPESARIAPTGEDRSRF